METTEMEQSMQWFVFFQRPAAAEERVHNKRREQIRYTSWSNPSCNTRSGMQNTRGNSDRRKESKGLRTRTARTRNRRMGNDRLARFLRLPAIGRLSGSGKSIPDTLLGQPQPFLSRMRHSYGTADSYHEEMPGVRQ